MFFTNLKIRASLVTAAALATCAASLPLYAAELRFDHQISLNYDFSGGKQTPKWSGGAMLALESNHSPGPQILKFGENGEPDERFVITVPGSTDVDVFGWAQGPNGTLAVCGSAYDADGRESGFLGILDEKKVNLKVVQLTPYEPFRVVVASDGSVWTTGLEMIKGKESGPGISPDHGVLKHFDGSGKLIASYLPRSSFPSNRFLTSGELVAGIGRIGWYTGPSNGPESKYYDVSLTGEIHSYPAPPLKENARVSGMGLTDDGRTYVSTFDADTKSSGLKSIAAGESTWRTDALTADLKEAKFFKVYGALSNNLVFWREKPSNVEFVRTSSDAR